VALVVLEKKISKDLSSYRGSCSENIRENFKKAKPRYIPAKN
jgi:hypothetical protein